MNTVSLIFGMGAALAVILGLVFAGFRYFAKQGNLTEDNSKALGSLQGAVESLTKELQATKGEMHELRGEVVQLNLRIGIQADRIAQQTDRITVLERSVRNGNAH